MATIRKKGWAVGNYSDGRLCCRQNPKTVSCAVGNYYEGIITMKVGCAVGNYCEGKLCCWQLL